MITLLGLLLLAAPVTVEPAMVARPAVLIGGRLSLVNYGDYPSASIRAGEEGIVAAQWTIGVDGTARDCRILNSSGFAALDQATCRSILKRARYTPATDTNGNAVEAQDAVQFRWAIR